MGRDSILIVEDNPLGMKLAEVLFASEGFDVHLAANAHEGLEILRRLRPDVVLTDLRLPDMDGLELARRIRADPATRDLVVLATSAEHGVDSERIRAAGCDGFVPKPIEVERVRAKLRRGPEGGPRAGAGAAGPASVVDSIRRAIGKLGLSGADPWLGRIAEEAEREIAQLRRALGEGDDETLRTVAHRMAGPSGMIGATRVAEACLALERGAAGGCGDPGVAAGLERVEAEVASMRSALAELAKEHGPT